MGNLIFFFVQLRLRKFFKKQSLKNKLSGYFKAYQDSTVLHVAEIYKTHSQLCNTLSFEAKNKKKQWEVIHVRSK